jgi:hypothetical protein
VTQGSLAQPLESHVLKKLVQAKFGVLLSEDTAACRACR